MLFEQGKSGFVHKMVHCFPCVNINGSLLGFLLNLRGSSLDIPL